jgi:hypothetical protein
MADVTTPTPANPGQKDWLAFATYFFPLVLIYTMIKKGGESNYVWHSKNAAGALVIDIVIQVLIQILWSIVTIPLLYTILNLATLALFILMVYGGWQAANGKLPTLPVVTQIGQKIPLEKWFKGSAMAPTAQSAAAPVPAPMASAPAPMPEPTPMAPAAPAPTEPTPPTPPTTPAA